MPLNTRLVGNICVQHAMHVSRKSSATSLERQRSEGGPVGQSAVRQSGASHAYHNRNVIDLRRPGTPIGDGVLLKGCSQAGASPKAPSVLVTYHAEEGRPSKRAAIK